MSHIRGRFSKPALDSVIKYTSSLPFDNRLYPEDVRGSVAHARMLAHQGIITEHEAQEIEEGLQTIKHELDKGLFVFKPELEDIHMAIESRLFELKGEVAGKLHTARSRNDQIALDIRMYLKERLNDTQSKIINLQNSLLDQAESNMDIIMPGCTHLQHAQPVLLSHHLLAYFEMLERDRHRIADCLNRTDVMPLGSGALAGTGFSINRGYVAEILGFSRISSNSMDAVSDRDFVIEYMSTASIIMMHLSRLAEELILWSSSQYAFVELDDAYATGSSIMPQKRNPDVAELARGKTGRVYGHLMAMLTVLKGLPLTYNRDLQEDKEPLFDTCDTVLSTLNVFSGMIKSLKFKPDAIRISTLKGYLTATDIADYLVKKGVSFREAHSITGKLVSFAVGIGKNLHELDLNQYQQFSPVFDQDVFMINIQYSVNSRNIPGGTAPQQVARAIKDARASIEQSS